MTYPVHKFHRVCAECGDAFESAARHADFCSQPCRRTFHNRRAVRGAELYDFLMAIRCDRKAATLVKAWTIVCHLISIYREEDARERAGRKSWRSLTEVLGSRPYLRARTLARATWKRAA